MAKSELELLQENNELLKGVLSSARPAASSPAPSAPSGLNLNPLTTAADLAAGAIRLLGTNSGYAAAGVEALSKVSGLIPGVGDAMSKMTSVAGEHIVSGTKNLQKSMDVGNLQQDLGLFQNQVGKSRSTMDEWNSSTLRGSDAMTSLAPVVTRGINNFATLSEELQQSKVGESMRAAGFSNKEMNDMLLVTAKNTKNLNMADADSRRQLINSAGELSLKIQEVSSVTGQSKSALLDKLEAEKKDAQLIVARQNMEPAQRAAFDNFRVSLNKLGPDAQELSKAFQTGGIRTAEQRAIFSAMGNLGPELQRVQKMQMEAGKDPAKRAAADAAQRNFEAKYFDYLRSKGVETRVNVDRSAAGDALRRMVVAGQEAGAGYQAGRREEPKATGAQVIAGQQRETALAIQGRDVTGKAIATAQPYRTTVGIEQAGKDIAAGASLKVKDLNEQINTSTGAFTKLNNVLKDLIAPRTTEQAAKVIEKPVVETGAALKKLIPGGKEATPKTALPADYKGAGSRMTGSLGAVGKLLEDFGTGTPMMLHGKEGVITEKQLQDVVSTVKGTADKDAALATAQSAQQIINSINSRLSATDKDKSFNVKDMVENTKQLAAQARQQTAPKQASVEMPKLPQANTAQISDQFTGMFSKVSQMQSSVTSKLSESKAAAPTTQNLESLVQKLSQSKQTTEEKEKPELKTATDTSKESVTSDVIKELVGLNMRMERLIAEVSNGTSKQLKATKGLSSNRIAV